MIEDRQDELASLLALDLLEGPERDGFLAELAGNPELQRRAGELREAAAALAHVAPEADPPEALRARVLASAASLADPEPVSPDAPHPAALAASVLQFPNWVAWLVAASIGVAAAWAEWRFAAVRSENAALGEEHRVAILALHQTREQLAEAKRLLADASRQVAVLSIRLKDEGDLAHYKIATLASMLGNSPAALAVAVWDPSREEGILAVSKLPAAASEKDYQLWVIDSQYPAPVNAGVFVVDPVTGEAQVVFKPDRPLRSIAKFAVSLERKGGVPKREGPIVLLSQ